MSKKALVVDDLVFARKIIVEILISAGYQVVAEASNGDEAIDAFRKFKPDFITMDVVMPKRNGIEAARTILEIDPNAKVIMVSAMANEQLLMDAINAGARDYILKPFSPEDIKRAVSKILKDDLEEDEARL